MEWKTFIHPHKAYRLEFPAHWENRVQDDGKSCGFGPEDRDNVGLWISILPFHFDAEDFAEDLPQAFEEVMRGHEAANLRRDTSLRYPAMKADITADGQGGNFWLIAGGDLLLLASTTVPPADRDDWNPHFDRLIASLRITRERELLFRRIAIEVLEGLRERHPEQGYEFADERIRGKGHVVNLDNIFREVEASPHRKDSIVQRFIDAISPSATRDLGGETWDEAAPLILPVLKPQAYIREGTPTEHLFSTPWLDDVLIVYAVRGEKAFRFVTGWDLGVWEVDGEELHRRAIENLAETEWPRRMEGSRQPGGGRLIMVHTGDSFDATRLLHPELHRLFHGPLGTPFVAAVPDRDTLVLFSNRRSLKKRIVRQVKKDHDRAPYPISPRLYLVTPDGIAQSAAN